jgi:phospholipase/lecithinase/hemolysin
MHPQAILGPLLTALVGPQTILGPASVATPHTIVSFGDSYTDTGFNSSGTLPSLQCPLGNPTCYTGASYTTGYNWLSSLTSLYNRTLTLTYNLAHSGDVLSSVLVPSRPHSILGDQLPQLRSLSIATPAGTENVLWSVFIGINDIGVAVQDGRNPQIPPFLDELQKRYFEHLLAGLWNDYGARRFLLWTVPDTARTPMFKGTPYEGMVRCATDGLNRRLVEGAVNFTRCYAGTEVVVFDAFSAFNEVLDCPVKYGFRDAVSVCEEQDCFWWDAYHPGEKAQILFGERVAEALEVVGWW